MSKRLIIALSILTSISLSAGPTSTISEGLQEVAQTLKEGSVNFGSAIGFHEDTQKTLVTVGKSLEATGEYLQTTAWEFGKNMSIDPTTFASLERLIATAGITAGGVALMTGGVMLAVKGIKDICTLQKKSPNSSTLDYWSQTKKFLTHNVMGISKCATGTGMFVGGLLMITRCNKLITKLS